MEQIQRRLHELSALVGNTPLLAIECEHKCRKHAAEAVSQEWPLPALDIAS